MTSDDENFCDECGEELEEGETDFCAHCSMALFGDDDDVDFDSEPIDE